jgi:hypothetical protein
VARAKNTDRAEARRRHREQQRADGDVVAQRLEDVQPVTGPPEPTASRPAFAMPDVPGDLRALPGMFMAKPLLWLPFLLLLAAFGIVLAQINEALPPGMVGDVAVFYVQMVLPPPPLVIFFIGGFLAPRASWLVGLILGVFYASLLTILNALSPAATGEVTSAELTESLAPIWIMSLGFGALAGGFAAWYRNFLRSSQERARANRAAREREQAAKAKEEARQARRGGR